MSQFSSYSEQCKNWVNHGINNYLDARLPNDELLSKCIRYCTLNRGKRIRAMLVHAACILAGGKPDDALAAACSVEFLHSYSLVHDDLPAMDDDDLRRGQPSCHKKFGEAHAILAGDALQALAFEVIATSPRLNDSLRIAQIGTLARAAGCQGMIAGQSMDIALTDKYKEPSVANIEAMHKGKTGALINASLEMGSYTTTDGDKIQEALKRYGDAIGLAFQVQDDILDITADTKTLGKPQGSDKEKEKVTYVSLMGIEGASRHLLILLNEANKALESFGDEADPLRWLAHFTVTRDK